MALRKLVTITVALVLASAGAVVTGTSANAGDVALVHFKSPHQLGALAAAWEYEATWDSWRSCPVVTNRCHVNIWSDAGIDQRRDSLFYSEAGRVASPSAMAKIVQSVHRAEGSLGLPPVRHRIGQTFYWTWQGVTNNPKAQTRLVLAVQGTRYGMLHQQAEGTKPLAAPDYITMPSMTREALRLSNPASGYIPLHGVQDFILIEP